MEKSGGRFRRRGSGDQQLIQTRSLAVIAGVEALQHAAGLPLLLAGQCAIAPDTDRAGHLPERRHLLVRPLLEGEDRAQPRRDLGARGIQFHAGTKLLFGGRVFVALPVNPAQRAMGQQFRTGGFRCPGKQDVRGFFSQGELPGRHLPGLRKQDGEPVRADRVVGLRGHHFAGRFQHAAAVSQGLEGGEIKLAAHLLVLALGVLSLPLVEQGQPLLRQGFGANRKDQVVLGTVRPVRGGRADCRQQQDAKSLHGRFTLKVWRESGFTSRSWLSSTLPSSTLRISYFPAGSLSFAGSTCSVPS